MGRLPKYRYAELQSNRRSKNSTTKQNNCQSSDTYLISKPRLTLRKADKEYCSKCIYQGSFSCDYLCNYIGITGKSRNCKAGVGCTQRVLTETIKPRNRKMMKVDDADV